MGYLDVAADNEDAILAAYMADWQNITAVVPQCILPAQMVGPWSIQKYDISPRQSEVLLRKDIRNNSGRRQVWTPAGTYTRLVTRHPVNFTYAGEMMYDTCEELGFLRDFLAQATGSILMSGLGLGILVGAALLRPDITSITVTEIEPDIISMVGKYFTDPRVTIINADCWTWVPSGGQTFDWAWHDPWGQPPTNIRQLYNHCSGFVTNQRFYMSVNSHVSV